MRLLHSAIVSPDCPLPRLLLDVLLIALEIMNKMRSCSHKECLSYRSASNSISLPLPSFTHDLNSAPCFPPLGHHTWSSIELSPTLDLGFSFCTNHSSGSPSQEIFATRATALGSLQSCLPNHESPRCVATEKRKTT